VPHFYSVFPRRTFAPAFTVGLEDEWLNIFFDNDVQLGDKIYHFGTDEVINWTKTIKERVFEKYEENEGEN